VAVLESCGVACVVPPQLSSGMPLVQYGYLEQASKTARANVATLLKHVREGCEVVCLEPTAEYCIKEVYPKLVKEQEAEFLAQHTHGLVDYLAERLSGMRACDDGRVAYHWPCHARRQGQPPTTPKLLSMLGFEVSFVDEGCCGMAGTWGMRRGYEGFEMSRRIGQSLAEALELTGAPTIVTDSTVCMLQLQQFSGREVIHTASLLRRLITASNANKASGEV